MSKKTKVTPFLMFNGQAEEAINFYTSLFEDTEIQSIVRNKENGTVTLAVFLLNGQEVMCIDSSIKHNFTFTPAISFFVTCQSEDEITRLFTQLSKGGKILMPLDGYDFSEKFGWTEDKFGVSWQLNLEGKENE